MAFMTLNHPESVLATIVLERPDCVVTGCRDGGVRVWDGAAWTCVQTLKHHTRSVLSLHAVDWLLVTGGSDGCVCLYDTSPGLPRTVTSVPSPAATGTPTVRTVGGFLPLTRVKVGGGSVHSLLVAPRWADAAASREEGGGGGGAAFLHYSIFAGCQDTRVHRVDVRLTRHVPPVTGRRVVHIDAYAPFHGSCGFVFSLLLLPRAGAAGRRGHGVEEGGHGAASSAVEDELCGGCGDGVVYRWPAGVGVCGDHDMVVHPLRGGDGDGDAGVTVGMKRRRSNSMGDDGGGGAAGAMPTVWLRGPDVPTITCAGMAASESTTVDPSSPSPPPSLPPVPPTSHLCLPGFAPAIPTASVARVATTTIPSLPNSRVPALPLALVVPPAMVHAPPTGPTTTSGLPGGCGSVFALAHHGNDIFTGCQDGTIRAFDEGTGHMKHVLWGHSDEVLALCIARDSEVATSWSEPSVGMPLVGNGGAVGVGDWESGDVGGTGPSALLCSASRDHTIRIWSARTYLCLRVISEHQGPVLALAVRGRMLFSASGDASVRVFDTTVLEEARQMSAGGAAARYGEVGGAVVMTPGGVADGATGLRVSASHGHLLAAHASLAPHLPPPPPLSLSHRHYHMSHAASVGGGLDALGGSTSARELGHLPPPPPLPLPHRYHAANAGVNASAWSSHRPAPLRMTSAPTTPDGPVSGGSEGGGADAGVLPSGGDGGGPSGEGMPTPLPSITSGRRPFFPPVSETFGLDLSQQGLLSCLREFIAIPSVSCNDASGTAEHRDVNACWRAAQYVHDLLLRVGAECRLVQGTAGCNPVVLGRIGGWSPDHPTICLQATYDVQPAGSVAAWDSPPFTLTGRDGYLYGRGTTDNKGPLLAMIFAVARYCQSARKWAGGGASAGGGAWAAMGEGEGEGCRPPPTRAVPPASFVFVIEGEGENGSTGFREAVTQNREWFAHTTVIVNCNNTWIGENTPCLTYGMRGIVKMRVEVEGAATDLHSGLDGGVSHEPLQDLCAVLGSLVDGATGRIAVSGLYAHVAPLPTNELALYRDVDFDVDSYMDVRGLSGVYAATNLTLVPGTPGPAVIPLAAAGVEAGEGGVLSLPPSSKRAAVVVGSGPGGQDHPAPPTSVSSRKQIAATGAADARADEWNVRHHVHHATDTTVGEGAAGGRDAPCGAGPDTAAWTMPPPSSLHSRDPLEEFAAPSPTATEGGGRSSPVAPATPAIATAMTTARPGAAATPTELDVPSAILLRRWREPALTVHGIACSSANDSIIPRKATGYISVRTVPHMTSASTLDAVTAHLNRALAARRSVNRLSVHMTAHAAWWLQDPCATHFQAAAAAIERHWGRPPIFVREGGTVRVTTFLEKVLNAPAIHIPLGQSSDSPHLSNERIRLLNLVTGMRVLQSFFLRLALAKAGLSQDLAV